jgi:UbiD family decarboxylase
MSDNVVVTGVFDLRRWLQKAKSIGQLKEVEGADLKFELGCITDPNAKRGGPALLFKNFKGYGEGFRVHTGSMMNAATLGLTLGFEGALSDLEVVNKVAEILRSAESRAKDFPVEYVSCRF